jgi:hypothetical protein
MGSREKGRKCSTNMHRFEKRIFKIRLFFIIMKKLLCDDGTGRDNDIQEHVSLKNDLMKIKQILFIKTVSYRFPFHTLFLKPTLGGMAKSCGLLNLLTGYLFVIRCKN